MGELFDRLLRKCVVRMTIALQPDEERSWRKLMAKQKANTRRLVRCEPMDSIGMLWGVMVSCIKMHVHLCFHNVKQVTEHVNATS